MSTPRRDARTGTWGFVVDVGIGPDGRRRQARRRGFPTKKAAQEELDAMRHAAGQGSFVAPSKLSLGDYLATWLAGLETAGHRPSTVASYRRNVANHVVPTLGGVRVQALTALHLDQLYASLRATGSRKTGGPLSARTVRYLHTIIQKALGDAVRKGLLTHNVAAAASPPSAKASRAPEMAWWRPEELRTFLAGVEDEYLFPLFRLAAMTGLRRGEVCGLRWEDVDLDASRLSVRQQLITVDHAVVIQAHPKSDHGRRTVDLDPETVTVLRAHRRRQLEQRLAIGTGWQDSGLVFTQVDGGPVDPESVAHVFARRVARSGLPRLRFHDLRHTHAAHLIAARRDALEVSRRLGHASPGFTLSKYGHLMPKADSEAASAVAALVDGGVGP